MQHGTRGRALVWGEPEQAGFLSDVARSAGLEIVAGGAPSASRATETALAAGNVAAISDLRGALSGTAGNVGGAGGARSGTGLEVDVVILADPGDFCDGEHDGDDVAALESARVRGVRVFTLEPMPGSVLQLDTPRLTGGDEGMGGAGETLLESAGVRLGPGSVGAAIGQVPTSRLAAALESLGGWAAYASPLRLSEPVRAAMEMREQFGTPSACVIECYGSAVHGSLGARLFDAVDAMDAVMGRPESCSASCAGPTMRGGIRVVPGDKLRRLSGTLSATLRYSDGRCGTIIASNQAGRWSRSITLIGPEGGGYLRMGDEGVEWVTGLGKVVESGKRSSEGEMDAGRVVGRQIGRMLDARATGGSGGSGGPPTDYRSVLAATGAMLLSCRTGECEEPETILRMVRGG